MKYFRLIAHPLQFKKAAGTSRGVLWQKPTHVLLFVDTQTGRTGIGEVSRIPQLSIDDIPHFAVAAFQALEQFVQHGQPIPSSLPSVQFAVETANLNLSQPIDRLFGEVAANRLRDGIYINGLIWMGTKAEMLQQIEEKIAQCFDCVKLKIGAIDFEEEVSLLRHIRQHYTQHEIEIRLDANGAFHTTDALQKLNRLAEFDIHSIEQPIKPGVAVHMAGLCAQSPIPIALDEELIGLNPNQAILKEIKPAYVILKPSLIGGFEVCRHWIALCEANGIGWWLTSALESNIGLNAIAQFAASYAPSLPQGLGTGQLFTNNFNSALVVEAGRLYYKDELPWEIPYL